MTPYAKIICDSISEDGDRLTTFEVRFHRFILAEVNTHRVLTKSSASSRAIPVSKQLERVRTDPAWPFSWPAERSGMQGGAELSSDALEAARAIWADAAEDAVLLAERLVDVGLHKSVVNRLLEPFMWHTAIITGTSFKNFFALRANPLAQPEFRVAAELMQKEYDRSTPVLLKEGEWHLPYINLPEDLTLSHEESIKVSVARCARVSYLTHDGVRDPAKDIELYERLISAEPMHSTPLQHCATPATENKHIVTVKRSSVPLTLILPLYGSYIGWHDYRYDVEAIKGYQAFS